jgi:hypothetical protein
MRRSKLLLLAAVFAVNANAETVVVTGYGDSYEGALKNAKIAALEKVAGTFIVSDTVWRSNESVFEQIKQYNGGVIKSYKILDQRQGQVTIEADVDVIKNNKIFVDNASAVDQDKLNANIDNFNSKLNIVKYLDDPKKAFYVKPMQVQAIPKGSHVSFKINTHVQWQPKWISDIKSFHSLIDDKGNTHTDTRDKVSGGLLNAAMTSNPYLGILGSLIYTGTQENHQRSQDPMICLSDRRTSSDITCYNIAGGFNNMPYNEMKVEVAAYDSNGKQIYKTNVDVQNNIMYEWVQAGEQKRSRWGVTRTFDQPAMIVYENQSMRFSIDLTMPTDIGKNVNNIIVRSI